MGYCFFLSAWFGGWTGKYTFFRVKCKFAISMHKLAHIFSIICKGFPTLDLGGLRHFKTSCIL